MKKVNLETIEKIVDYQKTAFIASVDKEGFPLIKAMLAPRKREGLTTFYFTTNTSSKRVREYLNNNKASIYFCDNRFFRGVLLRGTMEVLSDQESKSLIWEEGDTQYYPLGVTDPDYCVLRFIAKDGRYYSNFNSKDFEV